MRASRLGWLACTLVLFATGRVHAQSVEDSARVVAREVGYAGIEAYNAGDYSGALVKLEKAYAILKAPSLGLWSARALVKLGRLVEASERYRQVTRLAISSGEVEVQQSAQAEAAAELAALQPKLPRVVLALEGAEPGNVQISIDGKVIASALVGESQPIDPGVHRISCVHDGKRVERSVESREGVEERVVLSFSTGLGASAGPAERPAGVESNRTGSTPLTRTLGWIAIGAGGASVLVGTVTGVIAMGKKSDIDDNPSCSNDRCPRSESDTVDSYNAMRTVSSIGFIGGAVLGATGVVLVLTAPNGGEPNVALRIGPGSAVVSGRFR